MWIEDIEWDRGKNDIRESKCDWMRKKKLYKITWDQMDKEY